MKTTKVEVSLVLGQKEWDPDLADPESEKYKAFMAEFEAMVSYVTFFQDQHTCYHLKGDYCQDRIYCKLDNL